MSLNPKIFLKVLTCGICTIGLFGCAAGGFIGDKSEVSIDQSSVSSDFRTHLSTAKKIVFVSELPATPFIVEHMETNSSFEIAVLSPPSAYASPSQAQRFMTEVCGGPENPDLVLYMSQPTSNSTSGDMMGAIIGRAITNLDVNTESLHCNSQSRSRFSTVGKVNVGFADQMRVEQILGHKFSEELLKLTNQPVSM
jgi:hypothetical protein